MKKHNPNKPLTGRQKRRILRKPIEEMGMQELQDRYRALWDLIQENPITHYNYSAWLDEQAKIKGAIKSLEAKQPVGNYGNGELGNNTATA